MLYHEIINFSFSIPNWPTGVAEQDMFQILQKMMTVNIKLPGISGFASAGSRSSASKMLTCFATY
jgi:hypothetical protein